MDQGCNLIARVCCLLGGLSNLQISNATVAGLADVDTLGSVRLGQPADNQTGTLLADVDTLGSAASCEA